MVDVAILESSSEVIIGRLNQILFDTSIECMLSANGRSRKENNFRWSPILKLLVKANYKAYWEWKSNGRLKILTDHFYQNHRHRKKEMRQAQTQLTAEHRRREYEQIMEATEYDTSKSSTN